MKKVILAGFLILILMLCATNVEAISISALIAQIKQQILILQKQLLQMQIKEVQNNQIIYFYGNTCPYSKNIDTYIENNKINQNIKFSRLEVFGNADNYELMLQKASICGISKQDVGTPMVWDGKACYLGDSDVKVFFSKFSGIIK